MPQDPDTQATQEDRELLDDLRESIKEGLAGIVISKEESLRRVWRIARMKSNQEDE